VKRNLLGFEKSCFRRESFSLEDEIGDIGEESLMKEESLERVFIEEIAWKAWEEGSYEFSSLTL
jgi:hypothetical protein